MTNKLKIVSAIVASLVIGFILGVYGSQKEVVQPQPTNQLGSTVYDVQHFVGDVRQGLSDVLQFTGGFFVGNVSTTGSIVASSSAINNNLRSGSYLSDSDGGGTILAFATSTGNQGGANPVTASAATSSAAQICNNSIWLFTPGVPTSTIRFNASSTDIIAACGLRDGARKTLLLQNASTTAARMYLQWGDMASTTIMAVGTTTMSFTNATGTGLSSQLAFNAGSSTISADIILMSSSTGQLLWRLTWGQ